MRVLVFKTAKDQITTPLHDIDTLFILKFINVCVNNVCESLTSNQERYFQNGRQLWKQLVPEFINIAYLYTYTYHTPSDCYQDITKVFQNGCQQVSNIDKMVYHVQFLLSSGAF